MTPYAKPLPLIDEVSRPFWEAARRSELRLQRCAACGHVWHPPGPCCPECLSSRFDWTPMSGLGTVWSFIVYHHCWHPGFAGDIPYNVALVRLDEGPVVTTNIVGISNEQIQVGMPVTAAFDPVTEDVTLLKFRPR